jgi:hypothetical protein
VRSAGYSVYLLLDCKRRVEKGRRAESALGSGDEVVEAAAAPAPGVFRINASDLSFLRSLGIDPTRQLRRRPPRATSGDERADGER